MPEKRIFAKAGHVCMMCGFKATTKNKYRELQDHLSRRHFHERIKASLPTRRPFMCPDPSCTVEGKDWQALMRHYTGKHGVLEAYIKEFLSSHKENMHCGRPVSPLPPTNKIGCRRRRYKRHSSGSIEQPDPMAAEDGTLDPVIPTSRVPEFTENVDDPLSQQSEAAHEQPHHILHPAYVDGMSHHGTNGGSISVLRGLDGHCSVTSNANPNGTATCILNEANSATETILQMDESEPPVDTPPTHLALVLKRRKIGLDGLESEHPEETYAFVDLKYFQPLSANQYVMKSEVIEPSAMLNFSAGGHASSILHSHPPLLSHCQSISAGIGDGGIGGGGGYYLESGDTALSAIQSPAASYFESFPHQTTVTSTATPPPLTHIDFATTTVTTALAGANNCAVAVNCSPASPSTSQVNSAIYGIPISSCNGAGGGSYDQVVPNDPHNHATPSPPAVPHIINCASEVEISSCGNEVVQQGHVSFEHAVTTGPPQVTVMEVPIAIHHANITAVDVNPKGLNRGCSKVVVEKIQSIPMDCGHGAVTATSDHHTGSYELISADGMKEIDFTMF